MYPMQFSKIETAGTAEIVGIYEKEWWACLESNQGPRPYQGRALTN